VNYGAVSLKKNKLTINKKA